MQDYYPYGELLSNYITGSDNNGKYKFTGKECDAETMYDYFGARYYDNEIGRWLQVDPLAGKYPGWSTYKYGLDNPLKYIDKTGKTEKERQKALEAAKGLIGTPYKKVDCSNLVATSIKKSDHKFGDLRLKGTGADGATNGVAMIVGNSREVSVNEIRPGDLVTFQTTRSDQQGPGGKYDHIGLVENIDSKTQSIQVIQSSNSKGVSEMNYISDNKYFKPTGAYQWDTPEDNKIYNGGTAPTVVVNGGSAPSEIQAKPLHTPQLDAQ